jgi:hypothetical protein
MWRLPVNFNKLEIYDTFKVMEPIQQHIIQSPSD